MSGPSLPNGNRTVEIYPPSEMGPVTFERMSGGESLGAPFEFDVDVLSPTGDIPTAKVLGKPFSIALSQGDAPPRWFSGIVTRLAQVAWTGASFRYRAKLRPTLWMMTKVSTCRIFQNTTVPDLVIERLRAHGVTIKKHLGYEKYPKWEYLVQYNETDFNLVSRLMEQEGIFYYFVHEKGKHTMWLVDGLTIPDSVAGYDKIQFATTGDRAVAAGEHHEVIDSWSESLQVEPGAYAAKEFDFEEPGKPLLSTKPGPQPPATADMEIFEYPGHYINPSDRDEYVNRRLGEQQLDFQQVQGTGSARGLASGFLFSLTDHPAAAFNRQYLVTSASYALTATQHTTGGSDAGPDYRCSFVGIDGSRHYRPPLAAHKPRVQGPQTAIVVGPKGEEIWTDKYGRVRVHFHWDRLGARDETSSCLVRVSQVWAGSGWGAMHIPRIGQEVVVDFLEGDPDRPIITGRVYNAANMPPYALGTNATKSTIRSHSSKGGGPNNYNELCFEDKIGSEQIHMQAEKDLDILVKNDEARDVKHDRTKKVGNNETVTIVANRTETVGQDEKISIAGNRTESVGVNEKVTIAGTREKTVMLSETVIVGVARSANVGANETLFVGAKQTLQVGLDQSTEIGGGFTLKVAQDEKITVGGASTVSIAKDQTVNIGPKLMVTAKEEITFAAGSGASITLKKSGEITIKGKNITLDGSGDIVIKAGGNIKAKGSKIGQN
jgi:type VI secretion system secreted protein VgrG